VNGAMPLTGRQAQRPVLTPGLLRSGEAHVQPFERRAGACAAILAARKRFFRFGAGSPALLPTGRIAFTSSCVPIESYPTLGRTFAEVEAVMLRGGLLWLLGIPLPIILLLWFFGVFH
jgi:hypothetical protein